MTPLMHAAISGNYLALQALLDAAADPNITQRKSGELTLTLIDPNITQRKSGEPAWPPTLRDPH